MKKVSNKDLINAIRNEASEEFRERVPKMETERDARQLERIFDKYPTAKEQFMDTLINKVAKTEFFSKVYSNPLKMFKKGMLPFGSSIEEIFVNAAEAKGFFDVHSGESGAYDEPNALIKKVKPTMKALYIEKNFAYVFKTSISEQMLKTAFYNESGLSSMVNQITSSLINGAEQREFEDIKEILFTAANGQYLDYGTIGSEKGIPKKSDLATTPGVGVLQGMATQVVPGSGATKYHDLAIAIRTLIGQLKFPSTEYNMAKVKTWSNPEDLVFVTTPDIIANLDVDVLSAAFNVSKAELTVRTVLVDKLPTQMAKKSDLAKNKDVTKIYGFLIDKDFIQAWDTVNESRQFENGRALYRNLFLHRQGILANCYFANAVALVEKTPT